jgi:serine/threonine-protein kinase HipA
MEYCADCRRALFSRARVGTLLTFDVPERDQLSILSSYGRNRSLEEIRTEFALRQNGTRLELAEEAGSHILKIIPTGAFQRLDQLPANEHLTMQLAAQVYNIGVLPNATIYLYNGQNAYITRRLDLTQSTAYINKYPLNEIAANEERPVDSVEDIAALLRQYIAAYKPQVEHLFAIAIFNYLFSNNSPAYYQLSLIETAAGEYLLSPAYNLLCTELHESKKAFTLYNGDYASAEYVRNGAYSQTSFLVLAERIGIVEKRARRILARFMENELIVEQMVKHSFLDETARQEYIALYRSRLIGLKRN